MAYQGPSFTIRPGVLRSKLFLAHVSHRPLDKPAQNLLVQSSFIHRKCQTILDCFIEIITNNPLFKTWSKYVKPDRTP